MAPVTKYPVPAGERMAKTINDLKKRLRVTEQRSTSVATQANNAEANIRDLRNKAGTPPTGQTLQSQITTLQQQVENLFTKIGDPLQDGSGLTNLQSTFLAALGQMGNIGHPAPNNLTDTNNQLDTLLNELANQGYMSH